MNLPEQRAVVLPQGETGGSLFHKVLLETTDAFPAVFASARFPREQAVFKREYGAALARFEAARISSVERVDVARAIIDRTQSLLGYGNAQEVVPLREHMAQPAALPKLERRALGGQSSFVPEIPLDGRVYRGLEALRAVDQLHRECGLTSEARNALERILTRAHAEGGALSLAGERFVLLGAGAELAATRLLLAAGADVLWVDLASPAAFCADVRELGGSVSWAADAANILSKPREVAAAIEAFASGNSVHVGMFAYAGGASQEWRLGAAMNAIVACLPAGLVRSVSLLISPTTAMELSAESTAIIDARLRAAPAIQRGLAATGLFSAPAYYRQDTASVSLTTVSLQGLSYQAAQYVSKIVTAESYAVFGSTARAVSRAPLTVSANVAGITRTRSLSHPLFEAAFAGAAKFGVRIFEPATTRAVNGLLMLSDLLEARASATSLAPSEQARALRAQQVHGGIYALPYALEGVIRAAAVVGIALKPLTKLRAANMGKAAGFKSNVRPA